MSDAYGVMGHPIAHSRSPFIHTRFALATGEDLRYDAILVEPGTFPESVARFRAAGGRGLNVTLPFKEEAFALADRLSERARRARAVNTVWFADDGVHGDNTDGAGLLRDLQGNHRIALAGSRIVVLGAGGAARGVLGPLLDAKPALVHLANRTVERAHALAGEFTDAGPVSAGGLADLAGTGSFDVVVNATSTGLHDSMPALPDTLLAEGAACYEMAYGIEPTAFLRWAAAHGAAACIDGIGMLVEQAAESFLEWRGVRPETGPVIAALRELLGAEKPHS